MHRSLALVAIALIQPALPLQADEKADAEAMVKAAIAFAKEKGREAALKEVSNPKGQFRKGELYVFVYDLEGKVLAHGGDVRRVGSNQLSGKDPAGKFYVKERIELAKTKGKGWQDYKFMNPLTSKVEEKTSYIELHDGMIFGCGVYK
ncbi:MAG TPA: cache domain-containing protein [Holophagaceae bacterium]|nr:cache domain-containing protein [Holophagaceae bacterium]HJW32777.1 cache domain-containing protein [Holophagaceae bacterium]